MPASCAGAGEDYKNYMHGLKKHSEFSGSGCSLVSLNCRSVRNKIPEIMELACDDSVDMLCLQETWLRKCDGPLIKQIEEYGYKIVSERKSRAVDKGGRVAIIFKKSLKFRKKLSIFHRLPHK